MAIVRRTDGRGATDGGSPALRGELASVVKRAKEDLGNNVAMLASSSPRIKRCRTGILSLDLALGGGWAMSKAGMLKGEASAGKTLVAMKTAIQMQRMKPDDVVVWVDIEGTFDKEWFKKLGGDPERVLLIEPETGEHAVDLSYAAVKSVECSMFVVDSIAMLVPMKEADSSAGDSLPAIQSRLVGSFIRKMTLAILTERHRGHNPLVLYINQFRTKVGVSFGDPRVLPGGKALRFSVSQEVEVRNKEVADKSGLIMYNEHTCSITKNKTGGRFKQAMFKMLRNADDRPEGYINQSRTIVKWGSEAGIITGRYSINGVGDFRTYDELDQFLFENPDVNDELQDRIVDIMCDKWGVNH